MSDGYIRPEGGRQILSEMQRSPLSLPARIRKTIRPETVPLVVILGGALVMAGGFFGMQLYANPDYSVNRVRRADSMRFTEQEGRNWVSHHERMRAIAPRYSTKRAYLPAKE